MSDRWLAFVESNTSGTGRLFARAAARQGFRPILLGADPSRYPYVEEDAITALRVDTQDQQALLDTCRRLADEPGLAGVTSSSEYFIATAAAIARQLGLPGPRPEAILTCRDKHMQRLRLQKARVGVPAFRPAESAAKAVAAAERLGYPVVVKPINGSGSVGVKLCADAGELRAHAEALLGQRQNERGLPVPRRILVEELAVGPEYSVEVFGDHVVGITAKHLGAPPYFVEVGHDFPAALAPAAEQAIQRTVQRTLAALGLGWGPVHVELRLTRAGPAIIEVNPRLAGGYIPELVRLASGIDMITETIRLVAGGVAQLRPAHERYASIRFILSGQAGTLADVGGLDAARQVPGVAAVELYARPGSRVYCAGDFRDRIGHVIACGATPAETSAAAERAHRAIRVVIG